VKSTAYLRARPGKFNALPSREGAGFTTRTKTYFLAFSMFSNDFSYVLSLGSPELT
jgi:hypothetical protein